MSHLVLYSTCATKSRNESSLLESSSIFILYFYVKHFLHLYLNAEVIGIAAIIPRYPREKNHFVPFDYARGRLLMGQILCE